MMKDLFRTGTLARLGEAAGRWSPRTKWVAGAVLAVVLGAGVFGQWTRPPASASMADGSLGAPDVLGDARLFLSVVFNLGVLLALIYGGLHLLRRWHGGAALAARRQVTILETARLSPRQALHLVRAGKRVWLIGATDQALTLLAEVETPADPPADTTDSLPAPSSAFGAALARLQGAPLRPESTSPGARPE